MKSFNLFLSLLFVFSITTSGHLKAQKSQMKFGKIEPEYFEMKYYPADSAAEALIIGDYGEAKIEYDPLDGFVVKFSRHFRAKIFNKNGYHLATHGVSLYDYEGLTDKIMQFRARVYNMENGKIVESDVEKDMINEERIDKKNTYRKFTFPNVKEGSIIEFEIAVKSNYYQIPDWNFQHNVPALFSEYYVAYPEYFKYKRLQKGYLVFDENTSTSRTVTLSFSNIERSDGMVAHSNISYDKYEYIENMFRMRINNVPALKEEPYMNAVDNYISAVQFELSVFQPPYGVMKDFTRTWESINKELLDEPDFGLAIKRGGFLKETVARINGSASDNEQKMIMAFETVRDNMKWNELNRVYLTRDMPKCWESKSGSSAEINLTLVALLKELGLDAEPVIISTRSNGIIHPGQIMLGQFNYVLVSVVIGEKSFLLDATDKNCSYNMLTPRCINGQGRVISATRPGWVDLNSSTRYECTNIITASIAQDGTITGNVQRKFGNYAALSKRIDIQSKKDLDEYKQSLEEDYTGMTINAYETIDADKLEMPVGEKMEVEIRDAASVAGNLITLTPILFREWENNPFKLEERKYPVDYTYPYFIKDIITYRLPDGFVVDERPQDILLAMPEGKGKFTFRMAQNGNTLQLISTVEISKPQYTVEDYELLKQFYNSIIQKQAEKLVLKKSA